MFVGLSNGFLMFVPDLGILRPVFVPVFCRDHERAREPVAVLGQDSLVSVLEKPRRVVVDVSEPEDQLHGVPVASSGLVSGLNGQVVEVALLAVEGRSEPGLERGNGDDA